MSTLSVRRAHSGSARTSRVCALVFAVILTLPPLHTDAQACTGDCDGGGSVTVDELITMVNIALGLRSVAECPAGDASEDGNVTVDEIVTAVNLALNGCPVVVGTPTPTRTSEPTPTPTVPLSLSLSAVMNPAPIVVGEPLHIAITVTNPASIPAIGVELEAVVPNDLANFSRFLTSAVSCTSGTTCRSGDRIVWNLGTLAPGSGVTVDIPAVVASGTAAPAPATEIRLNAFARSNGVQLASTSDIVYVGERRFDLAVREDLDPVAPGDLLTYTITYGHTATGSVAQSVGLSFRLPGGTEFVSASDDVLPMGGRVAWFSSIHFDKLPPGAGGSKEVVVRVLESVRPGTILVGAADIEAEDERTSYAQTTTRVHERLPLELALEINPQPAQPGEALQVALKASNTASVDLLGVQVELLLPPGIDSFSELLSGGGDCPTILSGTSTSCIARERLTWNLGTLRGGDGRTVALPPVLSDLVPGSILTFHAAARDQTGRQTESTRALRVESARLWNLALRESRDPVPAGDLLTYTLTFNHATDDRVAENSHLRMPIPRGTQFVSASHSGAWDEVEGIVEWQLGSLTPGQGGERELVVAVSSSVPSGAILRADASLSESDPLDGYAKNSATATTLTRVRPTVPLSFDIEVNPHPARPGEAVQVALSVANTGSVDLLGVQVELLLPSGIDSFSELLSGGGDCPTILSGTSTSCIARERLTWNLGTLRVGDGRTVVLPPVVNAGTEANILTFNAIAHDDGGRQVEATQALRVHAGRTFDLGLHADRDPVAPETLLAYTLTFANSTTTSLAQNAVLRMPIPAGTQFVSASGAAQPIDGVVEWSLGTLHPGQGGEHALVVQVGDAAVAGELVRAEAEIHDDTAFRHTRAYARTRVHPGLPLELALEINPDPAHPGEALQAAITATNTGPIDLLGVQVELLLPTGIDSFHEQLTGGGDCPTILSGSSTTCIGRERVTWTLGSLPAGGGSTVTLPPLLSPQSGGGILPFRATARDASGRFVASSRAVRVHDARTFDLTVREDHDPVAPGDWLTYRLTFANATTDSLTQNTVLRMPIPAGTQVDATSDGGVLVSDVVEWQLGTLNPGQGGEREVRVQVGSEFAAGEIVRAQAEITDATPYRRTRATTHSRIHPGLPLELAMELNPHPARAGEALQIALTATNTGPIDLFGVRVALRLPAGIDSFHEQLTGGGDCPTILSGSSTTCIAREQLVWDLGSMRAGDGRSMMLPPVLGALTDGRVLTFTAFVQESSGRQVESTRALRVQSGRVFDLALREEFDPVVPGDDLVYTATFGNSSGNVLAQGVRLRVPVPLGTEFVSLGDDGNLVDDGVEWDLGNLAPGEGGERQFVVRVLDDAFAGEIVRAEAEVQDSTSLRRTRSTATTRVQLELPLELVMEVTPNPVRPAEAVQVALRATNTGIVDLVGVQLQLLLPTGIDNFSEALTGGGDCVAILTGSSTTCVGRERVTWDLGTLGVGETRALSAPPSISANAIPGRVVVFNGVVRDTQQRNALASGAVRVRNP